MFYLVRPFWLNLPPQWIAKYVSGSETEKIKFEREIRGRKEKWLLERSDVVIVSWGKSGRTWLRVLLSRYYKHLKNLSGNQLIGFANLHLRDRQIPKFLFTHGNYISDVSGKEDPLEQFKGKKIVFLARDPRDVVVSQFHQWKYRMKLRKKIINSYPLTDQTVFEFSLNESQGLESIIRFFREWYAKFQNSDNVFWLKYEDLRKDPIEQSKKLLDFIEGNFDQESIENAVSYSSFNSMKEREKSPWKSLSPWNLFNFRLQPKDRSNENSFKVRKGKVGGFKDYFNEGELDQIASKMQNLPEFFNYK